MDDFEACIAHLRFPVTHRRAIRTTNLLERLFVEESRRLKIIPNAFGERAVLKLMFDALIRAAERWRSIKVTEFEHRQITAVRKELDQEYEAQVGLKTQLSKDAAPVKNIQQSSDLSRTTQTSRALISPCRIFLRKSFARRRNCWLLVHSNGKLGISVSRAASDKLYHSSCWGKEGKADERLNRRRVVPTSCTNGFAPMHIKVRRENIPGCTLGLRPRAKTRPKLKST
jgi:Transposase, Mutator family